MLKQKKNLLYVRFSFSNRLSYPLFPSEEWKAFQILEKYDAFDVANLKRQLLAELRARGIKTLESSQQVKTNEYRENVREEKTMYDDESSSTALPANSSFLWSNRAKNLLFENMRSTVNENVDKIENGGQVYDDVGPLNLINQVINLTRKYIYYIRIWSFHGSKISVEHLSRYL